MTERRATITRGWRPQGVPARRHDDFVEVRAEPAPAQPQPQPARQVERRSIGRRLENWGAWNNIDNRGGGGADCMTGLVCENMVRNSKEALSLLPPRAPVGYGIDVPDAERVNKAFLKLAEEHRKVLSWTYVVGLKPWGVAGACGFPSREYDQRLAEAQGAIESVVNKYMERTR